MILLLLSSMKGIKGFIYGIIALFIYYWLHRICCSGAYLKITSELIVKFYWISVVFIILLLIIFFQ